MGRANEVGLVLERWATAQAGEGQVVLLSGEPGIGKSRLVQEVKERAVQQGKKTDAHQMLAEIYNWFTEGFARGEGAIGRIERLSHRAIEEVFFLNDSMAR